MDITRINKQCQVRISLCAHAHHNCAIGSRIALTVPLTIAGYIQNTFMRIPVHVLRGTMISEWFPGSNLYVPG